MPMHPVVTISRCLKWIGGIKARLESMCQLSSHWNVIQSSYITVNTRIHFQHVTEGGRIQQFYASRSVYMSKVALLDL